jgi:hypothetical protein
MRRFLAMLVVGLFLSCNTGCFLNIWSPDPVKRGEQLIYVSENYRQIENEWARFWFMDQPSHLTYERIHGGIGP